MSQEVDLIKSKLSIADVVGQYVQLKKAGRNLKGLCPFHSEKTPSFIVSPDKDIAYCFGCHKGGDIFSIVQAIEGVDFAESLRILAERAGVELSNAPTGVPREEKDTLFALHEDAVAYYQRILATSPEAAHARAYLEQRGLTSKTIQEFRIGFSLPKWDGLSQELRAKKYNTEDIVLAGLALQRDQRQDGIYDRFRGRIMFPLTNTQGRIVGFSGRIIEDVPDEPKYLNSAESPLYHKSAVLYGFPAARAKIRETGCVLFVEGQMDVVSLHQAGFTNAVATSGTALTPEHLSLIKRYTSHVRFAFDRDRAGIEATKRAMHLAGAQEMTIGIVYAPDGKDPDELLRTAPEVWQQAYEHPITPVSFYCDVVSDGADLSELTVKKRITSEFFTFVSACTSPVDQEHYLSQFSQRMGIALPVLQKEFSRQRAAVPGKRSPLRGTEMEQQAPSRSNITSTEDYLLGLLLQYPECIPVFQRFPRLPEAFSSFFTSIYTAVEQYYNTRAANFDLRDCFGSFPDRSSVERAASLALIAEESYADLSPDARAQEVSSLAALVAKKYVKDQLQGLTQSLKQAELRGDNTTVQLLLRQKRDIITQIETAQR